MSYLYSQHNRLEQPHSYMYAPFEGTAFLESYFSSRLQFLKIESPNPGRRHEPDQLLLSRSCRMLAGNFDAASHRCGAGFRQLLEVDAGSWLDGEDAENHPLDHLKSQLTHMTIAKPVVTSELSCALIASLLAGTHPTETKLWLDRLVQRFEVTKKLFDAYAPGFRKGEGSNTSVRLYWLLALALCLFHSRSNQIKYLSTLLKVCDLLCSLPDGALESEIPRFGRSTVLAAEITSVRLLIEKKELTIVSE